MASYRMMTQALKGAQPVLAAASTADNHFLHKAMLQIGMRSRERDTMPQLYSTSRFVNSYPIEPRINPVATPPVVNTAPTPDQSSFSVDFFNEISLTPIKTHQFQPRAPFLSNDDSPEQVQDFTHSHRARI